MKVLLTKRRGRRERRRRQVMSERESKVERRRRRERRRRQVMSERERASEWRGGEGWERQRGKDDGDHDEFFM